LSLISDATTYRPVFDEQGSQAGQKRFCLFWRHLEVLWLVGCLRYGAEFDVEGEKDVVEVR
jgi:hypothetical protein